MKHIFSILLVSFAALCAGQGLNIDGLPECAVSLFSSSISAQCIRAKRSCSNPVSLYLKNAESMSSAYALARAGLAASLAVSGAGALKPTKTVKNIFYLHAYREAHTRQQPYNMLSKYAIRMTRVNGCPPQWSSLWLTLLLVLR